MKSIKILLICSTFLYTLTPAQSLLINPDGTPSTSLQDLFSYFHIKHDGTLLDMAKKAQQTWWWVPADYTAMNTSMPDIEPLIAHLELIESKTATRLQSYTYALVVGGFVGTIKARIGYLKMLWDQGIRFENIIFLTGQRPLESNTWDSKEEVCQDNLKNLPIKADWSFDSSVAYATEYDMVKIVYDQLNFPPDLQKIPVVFVNTPLQKNEHEESQPLFAGEEVECWLATHPLPGTCLAITNQPYVAILDAILHNRLPSSFGTVDTVGYAINRRYHSVPMWLGAVSWLLYEEALFNSVIK